MGIGWEWNGKGREMEIICVRFINSICNLFYSRLVVLCTPFLWKSLVFFCCVVWFGDGMGWDGMGCCVFALMVVIVVWWCVLGFVSFFGI
ncbi:hypothetical protein P153DRAFT_197041 [Dothidotthia symphoricarpi CBS 119687]|uniref:Transmembrane protein n=1 Tax=Dothidotthia symphoricarpi CBS 119687 TaxID=1392245 RepID=A0A6A6AI69_9PLEO|nr:uncharacterized protein P153DRAFT_197041 [Dothidotthia symphoricarpi CBS 119687]KAF2131500.1 hypothetical protein P153DRAFT_197041 [Dothidotthia symphoricarpi CBS 119687]